MSNPTIPAAVPTHAVTVTVIIPSIDYETARRRVSDALWFSDESAAIEALDFGTRGEVKSI